MNEIKSEAKVMSNELAMIIMSRRPETVVHNTRKILSDRNVNPEKRIELAREYLNLLEKEDGGQDPIIVKPETKVKKPPKHNRIPFETKMNMINYYINNNCKKVDVAKKFGVAPQTCNKILLDYERNNPELFAHK